MALDEWCHWLEGAVLQLLVLADYKNLEHLKSVTYWVLTMRKQMLFQDCLITLRHFRKLPSCQLLVQSGLSTGPLRTRCWRFCETERLNPESEGGLRCMASQNPTSLSKVFFWINAYNTLPSTSTGFLRSTVFLCIKFQPTIYSISAVQCTVRLKVWLKHSGFVLSSLK